MYIRGAYFVGKSTTSNKLIDFFIVNPKNKVIFSRRKAEEGIFRFNTTMSGRYSFIFSNIKDRKSYKDVTIAIHTPESNEADLKQDKLEEDMLNNIITNGGKTDSASSDENQLRDMDIESLRMTIRNMYHEVRSLYSESKMSNIRQDGVNKIVQDNNSSSFYTALLESAIFIVIGAAQVMYIKNLLDSKRVI